MANQPRYPLRGAHGAPAFDGVPTHLNRYFEDIDIVLTGINPDVPEADLIRYAKHYLDTDTCLLWETLTPEPHPEWTWDTFKAAVRRLYPGSDGGRLFSVADLDRFISDSAQKGVYTRAEHGEYYRDFLRITSHLITSQRMSTNDRNRLYILGFGDHTRRRIESRLAIILPDHHPEDPYPMNEVHAAAEFLLSSTSPHSVTTDQFSGPVRFASSIPGRETKPVVKKEELDMSAALATFASTMARLESILAAQSLELAKRSIPRTTNAPANRTCNFCSEPGHFVGACPKALEYIKSGKCMRNSEGRICLPSGRYLPGTIVGNNLSERFDKYYATYQSQNTQPATTAVFEAQPAGLSGEAAGTEDASDEEDGEIIALENMARTFANDLAKKMDKGKRKPPAPRNNDPQPSRLPPPPAVVITPAQVTRPSKPERIERPDVQYHYQAPIENPVTVQQVFNRALDIPVRVTPRELLAISGDIRKKMKDMVTARRVPVTTSAVQDTLYTNVTAPDTSDLVVAVDAAPLRTVEGILDGRIAAECLLDQGSSIVAMRRDVWEKLGNPLHSEHVIHMESSHGTIAPTLGLIKNFPLQIGPCTFHVQMQVADTLPCEVLVGRPFFMLTGSQTIDHPHGAQDLILNNPNTGERIIVPTKERIPVRKTSKNKKQHPDF